MRSLPLLLLLAGCAFEPPPADPPSPSVEGFSSEVYPVLLRDCGFPACHGDRGRFFRVFGPGRARLDESTPVTAPVSDDEVMATYERARSMLASAHRAEESLLLRKPLEIDAGGAPHMGVDGHGRDVYASPDAAGYRTIFAWARPAFAEGGP